MHRRDLLASLVAASAVAAGCVERGSPAEPRSTGGTTTAERRTPEERTTGATPPATETTPPATETGGSTTTDCTPPAVDERWVRCRGNPVSASETVTDEPGYDDEMEYYPENGTVRVATHMSGDDPVRFDNWSFERWGSFAAADVAIEKARAVTERRLGSDAFASALGELPASADVEPLDGSVIQLWLVTRFVDCEVERSPATLSEFADLAPRSVDATVTLDGDEYSRSVPVYASHRLDRWDR